MRNIRESEGIEQWAMGNGQCGRSERSIMCHHRRVQDFHDYFALPVIDLLACMNDHSGTSVAGQNSFYSLLVHI